MRAESVSARLNRLSLERCVPISAQLELTRRCPLRCRHCYLPAGGSEGELTTAEWKGVLRQLSRLGTLSVVFTGGEPLLRPDLPELCAHATALGFEIRIFTSGQGLTSALTAALAKSNISGFELSLYGREKAHDAVTRRPGSARRTLAAARLLKKAGLRVKLKTPLMKTTAPELPYLRRLARGKGYGFALDPVLTPPLDGRRGAAPVAARLLPALLAADLTAAENPCGAPDPDSPPCGAGRNTLAVSSRGELLPCLQLPVPLGDARRGLASLWKSSTWLKRWRRVKTSDSPECRACPHLAWCSRCPGAALQLAGDIFSPYPAACALARAAHKCYRP
jgi:radical SAM protein with 4Fe4S-binding SPASM domain